MVPENRHQSSAGSSTPPWLLSDWPLCGLVLDSRRFYTEECMGESWKCSKPPLNLEPKWSLSWPREILAALKPNIRFAKWTMLRALMRPSAKYDGMMWNDMECAEWYGMIRFFPHCRGVLRWSSDNCTRNLSGLFTWPRTKQWSDTPWHTCRLERPSISWKIPKMSWQLRCITFH